MKLLSKSQLSAAKQRETSREIQEGLKLTRRVDALRELRLSEEKQLEDWRRETLASAQAQINLLIGKRDLLEKEVKDMQSKLDSMLPSLALKRTELDSLEKSLANKEKELEKRSEDVLMQELDIAEAKKEAQKSLEEAKSSEMTAKKNKNDSSEKLYQAKERLKSANLLHERLAEEKKDFEREMFLKNQALELREGKVSLVELKNIKIARENADEKIRLADERAVLQRELNRLRQLRQ